jgi:DMSO/TMAO reductase YedYZ molybdopterin-dependent catalytic subunit
MLTAPLIAILYLGDQLASLPFLPFDLFDWVTRLLPGPVITFGIDTMIDAMLLLGVDVADTAKTAEQAMAVLQFLALGVVAGAVGAALLQALGLTGRSRARTAGLVLGALFGLPLIAIHVAIGNAGLLGPAARAAWLLILFLGWGLAFTWMYARLAEGESGTVRRPVTTESGAGSVGDRPEHLGARSGDQPELSGVQRLNRRQFLIVMGAAAATITVAGAGLGAVLARAERRREEAELEDSMAHQAEGSEGRAFPNADDLVIPAPGTRPEYTPLKDHYRVFIRAEPTVIDGSTWALPVTGLVDNPLMLTTSDMRARFPRRDQYVTLSCISGRVGTTLISTTLWSGAGLQEVLAEAQIRPEARYLIVTSGDGFHETISVDTINSDERIMLCYDWDGHPLPEEHGFPLRVWIPDRFGMKQPKWITGIEVTDTYQEGYWVERGWDEVARVQLTSVIDTVAVDAAYEADGQQRIPVGGIAFSGARGISKVEVRVDGGEWTEAQLRTPLSETTWAIWRYDWPFSAGHHLFEVRCVDGDGIPQIERESEAHPSGATGIHRQEAEV